MSVVETKQAFTGRINLQTGRMNAIVYDSYGDANVLRYSERPIPHRLPGQLLIQVVASSVNPIDYRMRSGQMKYILPGGFPRIPGYDVAGVIADCADDVSLKVGDRVMAYLSSVRGGAYADFALCAVGSVAKIPDSMPFDEAAAMPLAGTTALQSLRDHGKLRSDGHVLINGASGGVGMFAVQIAKAFGCKVDAVASAANQEFCLSMGADRFIDYRQTNFVNLAEKWDLVFDVAGTSSYLKARPVLSKAGRYVTTEPDAKGIVTTLLTWPLSKSGKAMLAKPRSDDLNELIRLYEQGRLKISIDSRYAMRDAANAHRRVESGVDHGKVVLLNDEF